MAISSPATKASFSGAVNVAVTVVAISFCPGGSFATSGWRENRTADWSNTARQERDQHCDEGFQQPRAQLQQVRDQRAFRQRLIVLAHGFPPEPARLSAGCLWVGQHPDRAAARSVALALACCDGGFHMCFRSAARWI
jgi:hypothetical protein